MSFPKLVLTGNSGLRYISGISVLHEGDTDPTTKPASLTRSTYSVRREERIDNVSVGTKQRYPSMPYNSSRLIHSWTGYLDVLSESVAGSAEYVITNMALIKSAFILNITAGIPFTTTTYLTADLGPNKPTLIGTYAEVFEPGYDWLYAVTSDEADPPVYTNEGTVLWFIKNIKIQDNQNNTSRVTFSFEIVEPWFDLKDIIDAIEAE